MQGDESNTFLRARAELLLQDANRFTGLNTSDECLAYLGARFRAMSMRADSTSDVDIGHYMIQRYVLLFRVCIYTLANFSQSSHFLSLLFPASEYVGEQIRSNSPI